MDAYILNYGRSPFCNAYKGALKSVRPDDLLAIILAAIVDRAGIDANALEDVIAGCAFPEAEQGYNIARQASLLAGLPHSVAGTTVNRFCGSSMQAIHMAAGAIAVSAGHAFIACGVESMSRVPMMGFNNIMNPSLMEKMPQAYTGMGMTAENLARRYGITREAQEAFAVESHAKASRAQAAGLLADEIIAIDTAQGQLVADGCIRPDTTTDSLAKLKLAFDVNGCVTAGTSSPLTDGAAAVIVVSGDFVKAHGLRPLARIRSMAVAGCEPDYMGYGPVPAVRKALIRAGVSHADIDVIESNEAFAAQALTVMRELEFDASRVNIDGGALALGHPLGATGARITGKAAALLQREGKNLAIATQCVGGGQGIATVLEAY